MNPVVRKNITRFIEQERELRAQLGLPPATWQTVIRRSVTRTNVPKEHAYLEKMFEMWSPVITARQGTRKNIVQVTLVIHTADHPTNDDGLIRRIYGLGPMYTVQTNQ